MDLRLYDTLTREKRVFTPIDPDNVRMYVCGPTVYDFAHIGNARPVIVFDVLFRLLRYIYGDAHVTYVRNITDVDDKINDRALRDYPGLPLNEAIRQVTEKTADQFQADVAALGCLAPTVQPRATEFVLPRPDGKTDMVTLIAQLIERGHAYAAEGEVLFDTQSMPDYGALSGRKLEDQQAGARVAVDAHKKHPTDFVLWKQSSPDEPGWDSPWGRGRPGWHIECSAMSAAYLGTTFDIHGGGLDLIFPHHENEIAQSRCAHGSHAMANYWMHNGFLQVEGEKMSKSLGNFVTINELLGKYHGTVLRYNMLRTQYRQPIDWRIAELERARHELWSMSEIILDMGVEEEFLRPSSELVDRMFLSILCDDLNVPNAITRIRELSTEARKDREKAKIFAATVSWLGLKDLNLKNRFTDVFASYVPDEKMSLYFSVREELTKFKNFSANGSTASAESILKMITDKGVHASFGEQGLSISFADSEAETLEDRIARLITERSAARSRKDFAESDRIRDELAKMKVVLKDGKDAAGKPLTTWEIARDEPS